MRILSVGTMDGLSNTCLHRNWALEKVADKVDVINTSAKKCTLWYRIAYHLFLYGLPVYLPESDDENRRIRKMIDENIYDVVWIDKGNTISPDTLRYIKIKQPQCMIVSYSPDNMALRHNQSQQYLGCIPLYDYHITTKSYILDDMKRLGAKRIKFVPQSYALEFHHPYDVTPRDIERLGGDVGFIGAWEQERCDSILYLAKNGISVRVFGGGKWLKYNGLYSTLKIEPQGLFSEDYSKSFRTFKISLCFLRKMNFDQQTSRTMEIPACGGFMLAERTKEHQALFEEGKEAEFFSSNEELLEKCRYYLAHDDERKAIAEAGHLRCITSDYSNEGMVRKVLKEILGNKM